MKPLVSILIPAYNAEKWIAETIRSALNQTWPNIEIIVVDDGSIDNTRNIAQKFASLNAKILDNEHKGASAARNEAFRKSKGEYIQWLDADDILAPDKISLQMDTVEKGLHPSDLLSAPYGCFYSFVENAFFEPTSLWQDLEPVEWIVNKFTDYTWMNPTSFLVSRKLTEETGPWDEELSFNDDGEYFVRLISLSRKVIFIKDAYSYHRLHPLNMSRQKTEQACSSLWRSLDLSINHLLKLEDTKRTRKAAINLLQDWYIYFYPEKKNLMQQLNIKATALDGKVVPPPLDPEYMLIKPLVGWKGVKKVMNMISDLKLRINTIKDLGTVKKT